MELLKEGKLIYLINGNSFLTEKDNSLVLQTEKARESRWTVGLVSNRGTITLTSRHNRRLVALTGGSSQVGLAPAPTVNYSCEWLPSAEGHCITLEVSQPYNMGKQVTPAKRKQKTTAQHPGSLSRLKREATFLFAQTKGVGHRKRNSYTVHRILWKVEQVVNWKSPNQRATNTERGSTSAPNQKDKGKDPANTQSSVRDDFCNRLQQILRNEVRVFLDRILTEVEKERIKDILPLLRSCTSIAKTAKTFVEHLDIVRKRLFELKGKLDAMEDAKRAGAVVEEILDAETRLTEAKEDLVVYLREALAHYLFPE